MQAHIAAELGIDPSQVSRIFNGQFVRPTGHALQICTYCRAKLVAATPGQKDLLNQLEAVGHRLAAGDPDVAAAVVVLLNALAPAS